MQVGQGLVLTALCIPDEPVDERIEQRSRNGVANHDGCERTIGLERLRLPSVDRIKTILEHGYGGMLVFAQIDGVIGQSAKAIQRGGAAPHVRRQQQRGGKKRFRPAPHQRAQCVLVDSR